jgi:GTP-binding protein
MIIKTATFVISNSDVSKCPAPRLPEYAFIGRSNVGKSSLINMLTNRAKLAKTSGKPGKTQLINHFLINDNWYLVDLPGYGYARTSKELIAGFSKINHDYIANRPNLLNLFVLIDIRLEPQEIDLKFLRWLGSNGVPFTILFTKADKLTRNKIQSNLAAYKKVVLLEWEEMPIYIVTSAETGSGKDEVLQLIESTNNTFGLQAIIRNEGEPK